MCDFTINFQSAKTQYCVCETIFLAYTPSYRSELEPELPAEKMSRNTTYLYQVSHYKNTGTILIT